MPADIKLMRTLQSAHELCIERLEPMVQAHPEAITVPQIIRAQQVLRVVLELHRSHARLLRDMAHVDELAEEIKAAARSPR